MTAISKATARRITVTLLLRRDVPASRGPAAWRSLLRHNPCLRAASLAVAAAGPRAEETAAAAAAGIVAAEPSSSAPGVLAHAQLGRALNDALLTVLFQRGGKDLWLLWDAAFDCTRPFLVSAASALRASPGAWSLQLTRDWIDDLEPDRLERGDGHTLVLPHPDREQQQSLDPALYDDSYLDFWPTLSLRPTLHRLSRLRENRPSLERFCEDPRASDVEVEWRFGVGWEAAGGAAAVLEPHCAEWAPYRRRRRRRTAVARRAREYQEEEEEEEDV
jgi:hypothetical protein